MNIFNLFRKHDELRREFDALKRDLNAHLSDEIKYRNNQAEMQRKEWDRLDKIEQAVAAIDSGIADELQELRQQAEVRRKRQSSGRPFSVLSKLAELGELKRGEKQNA